MKNKWIAAVLNFFFMGLGYLYNGKRTVLGILLTIGALLLTYLEQFYTFADGNTLQGHDGSAFALMAGAVFIVNTGLAMDGYQEAQSINNSK
ncbi:MAG: hypothetical protein CL840_08820 [Crocinitomicaceae bacterium]|nr:hypothetical protein [Crocinitomicaceae bacterium]|tara:strand:+ start:59436 stop:59711 length:276 start_codon:yes stop_codon:yes gene_type:complete